jgi:hypothetical protein
VVCLFAPLAGAALNARNAACCMSDHCPIPEHHHKRGPAAPSSHPTAMNHDGMSHGMDHMAMGHDTMNHSGPLAVEHGVTNAPDCGHNLAMSDCSMSCCQQDEIAATVALSFVVPQAVSFCAPLAVTAGAEALRAIPSPRSLEPISPPPRFASAAA